MTIDARDIKGAHGAYKVLQRDVESGKERDMGGGVQVPA